MVVVVVVMVLKVAVMLLCKRHVFLVGAGGCHGPAVPKKCLKSAYGYLS